MPDEGSDLILKHLRAICAEFVEFREDMKDVKRRLTSLEVSVANLRGEVANLHGDFVGQSGRIDRVENRLERIERRLALRDA